MSTTTPHHRAAVDAERWPDVARVPAASAARAAVTRALVARAARRLNLRVRTPAGPLPGTGGPLLEVTDPDAFHARLGRHGLIGFGESYLAGEWDSPELVAVLTELAGHAATLVPPPLQRLRRLWAVRQPARARNSPSDARRNIGHHYDLSNELFALFLDPTLSYSSALFPTLPAEADDLRAAQHRKIDRLLDLAEVGPGTRLLEIGTGWGELALRAADRGATVRTVTLSTEQLTLARRRIAQAGHAARVTVELADYRHLTGSYDAVVSVEMIEAVGARHWPTYFRVLDRLTAPGGRVALQAIVMPHDRMLASRATHTWVQKYVFPGGLLPSTRALTTLTARHTRFAVTRHDGFGAHYAETLRLWRERFTARREEALALGFDETFLRMWTFYLAYSEAGFRSRYLDVRQLLLTDPRTGGPR
ncbi:class I SAM-dependent methyltransferase [Streptomyces sp. DSM 44915]|uniref:Class I SAM-dependent methyltransferase n=1 Tax=Streptomyces chisholmiae TaxID=3075540 RepID=A0ABU2JR73_9ACTN|nr:class I SAM-dependent methyltransferase [Streptomyces sp. DSM 44915]MDT0267482.1 class I SAM-dependent methyltransferase [Streptomyces sp. DSM 44915]